MLCADLIGATPRRLLLRWSIPLLILSFGALRSPAAEPQIVDVFVSGTEGYNTYCIPALTCTPKGTLLAFCEGRQLYREDETPTDLLLRRSLDGGTTWLPMQTVVKAVPEAAVRPNVTVDHATGAILLVYALFPELVKEHWPADYQRAAGLGRDSITTWVTTSRDEGATWSAPRDITAMVKKPEWTRTFPGPGVGIQTRSGRLVVPCAQNRPEPPTRPAWVGTWWNYAIYSDDHGTTWTLSDNGVGPGLDESQVVELADGTLFLNMRGGAQRRTGATSGDGGKTWSQPFPIPELPDPTCQASILRYSWPDPQGGKSRILFCNPATTGPFMAGRRAGTVRLSYDEGKTWPVAKLLYPGSFGYCCLTAMPNGDIGCLFDVLNAFGEPKNTDVSRIKFARLELAWLSAGKDLWKP
jgi:sialidase-1